jgi:hypothetical protein
MAVAHAPEMIREPPERPALLVSETQPPVEVQGALTSFERIGELIGEITLVRVDLEEFGDVR